MTFLGSLKEIDADLLLSANHHYSHFLDRIMWFASGDLSWIPFYLILIAVIIRKYKKESILIIGLIIPLIILSDQLASGLIKPLVGRPRPSHTDGLQDQLRYLYEYRGGMYGFISSHACNVFALAVYLTNTCRKRLPWVPYLMFPWAILVSYSRLYLGVHYPSDVIVAAVLGSILGWLLFNAYLLANWYKKHHHQPRMSSSRNRRKHEF